MPQRITRDIGVTGRAVELATGIASQKTERAER